MANNTFRGWLYALLAAVCVWASTASAAIVDVTLDAAVLPITTSIVLGQVDNTVPGVVTFSGSSGLDSVGSIDWSVTADPDPFIDATFTITNTSTATQTIGLLFTLPILAPPGPVLKSGSLAASFVDGGDDGAATLNIINWDGLIDGAVAMELFSGGVTCGGTGCNGSIGPVSDALVDPNGANTSIGIDVLFSLTAEDTATFNTRFEVAAVPVPAAVWLFGSGLLGLIGIARRKKAA